MGRFIPWLSGEEAEFIVGRCVDIDGGQRA